MKRNRFHLEFGDDECAQIKYALESYLSSINSFLEDSEGDDVQSVVDDRELVKVLIAEISIPWKPRK